MKVLVVDDDSISRMVLSSILASLGVFDIYEAEDGAIALQMLQSGLRPAICFCDGRMPNLSGLGLLEKVAADQKLRTMPFVMASANDECEATQRAMELGAVGSVVKPYDIGEVRAQLNHHVRTLWTNLTENPNTSLKRLHLSAPQLLGYLQAFFGQLEQANAELGVQDLSVSQKKFEKFQQASLTLGLYSAANLFAEARAEGQTEGDLQRSLQVVKNIVDYQAGLVRAMLPAAGKAG
jgi:two-component system chemotaxis response regulator CheY